MSNEDRYHTTSWDGGQVRRQAAGEPSQPSRPSGGSGKKKAKKKRTNPFLALLLWVVVVIASSVILAGVGWMLANDLCAFTGADQEVEVVVPAEWFTTTTVTDEDGNTEEVSLCDIGQVADALQDAGLIQYKWLFRLFAWVYDADEKIDQGAYVLNTNMDYMALVRGMRSTGSSAVTVEVSIPEGYNTQQIFQLLSENGVAPVEELEEAAANYEFVDYAFLDSDLLGDVRRVEGYLYPDTYQFYVGRSAVAALDSMLSNFNSRVYSNGELTPLFEEAAARGYDFSDIITIASLIEEETDGTDRDKIASVIYNRLERPGETGGLLQIDAALVYAAGRAITQEDYTTLDSPYNLYQHTGLPPTAISNPGMSSITAALQPAETDYYYYVLGADGKHVFSETLSEHQQNVAAASAASGD
ncbi:MAG TPA: endolytic transglycosylase MltG [Candidatus Pelethomonas intestinigallinarum]|nr:endolytic transglycosylase MltG [Candidatus Pelethomonas intestinigallinarum]